MATVGTHDMPPAAAFLTGEQITIRAGLGLLTRPEEEEERAVARLETGRWLDMLGRDGLLPPGARPSPEEFTVALYAYLTRTPAMLVGVCSPMPRANDARRTCRARWTSIPTGGSR